MARKHDDKVRDGGREVTHPSERIEAASAAETALSEDVRHVSDDVAADGTPLVGGAPRGFVAGTPDYDGESDRFYSEVQGARSVPPAPAAAEEAPLVNRHSPDGARLEELKMLRPVVYAARNADAGDDPANDGTADGHASGAGAGETDA
jgi:hypothetical protein